VESEEGFSVGDTIVITGGGNSETRDIASFGSIVLDAPLNYGYPAGSSITKVDDSDSSNAPSAEEQQHISAVSTAVFAGVVIFLLACVAFGCLMRRRCRSRCRRLMRNPASERGMRNAEIGAGRVVPQRDVEIEVELLESMDFWFIPAEEVLRMQPNEPIPRHQELRDAGLLVKRTMSLDDVLAGRFVADTAAVSHRWPEPHHFDPDCSKLRVLQEILANDPSIRFLWIDWVCAPQWNGGGRTTAEDEEFSLILENILPFIFLGCTVIVLYERIYNQRFWPNVECWISTKMPTESGLVPASEDKLRMRVYGIDSATGNDTANTAYLLGSWLHSDAQKAILTLSHKDILVTNAKDKEINLKVVGSLDDRIRSRHVISI